jgi:hypothetical protein
LITKDLKCYIYITSAKTADPHQLQSTHSIQFLVCIGLFLVCFSVWRFDLGSFAGRFDADTLAPRGGPPARPLSRIWMGSRPCLTPIPALRDRGYKHAAPEAVGRRSPSVQDRFPEWSQSGLTSAATESQQNVMSKNNACHVASIGHFSRGEEKVIVSHYRNRK